MLTLWCIVAAVLLNLLIERIVVRAVTLNPKGREWIRRTPILHPNGISIMRIPMGAVAIWMAHQGWWAAGALWFAFWMISDLSDGTIARNCDLITESGKWLDPLSDKAMYFPGLLYCSLSSSVLLPLPWPWVCAFLIIDTLGQASRLLIKKKAANYFGKAKTAFVTILLTLTALHQIHELPFMTPAFVYAIMVSCTLLAFMSAYCKVIPDTWYANNMTLANFICGLAAIWSVMAGHSLRAFVLVFIGQFFDLFDGRLASIFGSTRHGPMFDDIADGTSFGLAISFLIMAQLRLGLPTYVAVAAACLYLGCVVYRLYRFLHPSEPMPAGIFSGLPSPAGAMLAGSSVLVFGETLPYLALAMVLATSILMISPLRYRHFARHIWPNLPRGLKLVVCILLLIFVDAAFSHRLYTISFSVFCLSLAIMYCIFGIQYRAYFGEESGVPGEEKADEAAQETAESS